MPQTILERPYTSRNDTANVPDSVLVVGASGGIGQAYSRQITTQFPHARLIRFARDLSKLDTLPVETLDYAIDYDDIESLDNAIAALPNALTIDWVLVATGWLHDETFHPEKSYRALDADHLQRAFWQNTVGPTLLVKALLNRSNTKHPLKIGILSARVGSISDNRLGGWHAYRASKAALNMLIKNFAIEFGRMKRPWIIVGLQPGTTDTELSKPFQRSVAPEHLQTPTYTASQLLKVMRALEAQDSGKLFDFLGLQFEP